MIANSRFHNKQQVWLRRLGPSYGPQYRAEVVGQTVPETNNFEGRYIVRLIDALPYTQWDCIEVAACNIDPWDISV